MMSISYGQIVCGLFFIVLFPIQKNARRRLKHHVKNASERLGTGTETTSKSSLTTKQTDFFSFSEKISLSPNQNVSG